ncbi:MAG: hypothetical protein QOJ03_542, partial [Frankiaceae bacterium]|nr:hypothetical protein [Frankiaceae bacterium]
MSPDIARALDTQLTDTVLVTGRQVPGSADLELVVRPAARARVAEALSSLGFAQRGRTWARFRSCDADVVTVHELDPGRLPAEELERLEHDAVPVDGCARLRWLATPDELLVLARRLSIELIDATQDRRRLLHQTLVSEPSAWVDAAMRAELWQLPGAVRIARDAFDGARPIGARERRELARETGKALPAAATGVIALSGLDGSGKSTQAHALGATLLKLGYDVSVEWTRLSFDASLDVVAAPVKALLSLRGRGLRARRSEAGAGPDPATQPTADVEARGLRGRSRVVNQTWTGVVATANGMTQRRTTRAQLDANRVVIRDRYVLDSVVQLHSVYGTRHDVSRQARLVESLSP